MSRWFPQVPRTHSEGPAKSHVNRQGAPKKAFPTRQHAFERAREINLANGKELHAYQCGQPPEHWHLSSSGWPDLIPSSPRKRVTP